MIKEVSILKREGTTEVSLFDYANNTETTKKKTRLYQKRK